MTPQKFDSRETLIRRLAHPVSNIVRGAFLANVPDLNDPVFHISSLPFLKMRLNASFPRLDFPNVGDHEPPQPKANGGSMCRFEWKSEIKTVSPRTGTAYTVAGPGKVAPSCAEATEDKQHERNRLIWSRVNGGVARRKFAHLIWGDLSGIRFCQMSNRLGRIMKRLACFVSARPWA